MTVEEMWGRVQGNDVLPLSRDGDEWFFPTPSGMSGTLVCEFWAEDDAGNIGYRAALITLDKGAIKCWRWLDMGCECILRAWRHPVAEMEDGRPTAEMDAVRAVTLLTTELPSCTLRPFVCPRAGGNA